MQMYDKLEDAPVQTTIKSAISFSGTGLHSGLPATVTLRPASAHHGIWFSRSDVAVGDRLLLCSDGLSDLVDDRDIALVLAVPDSQHAADLLVEAALDSGGTDNVTCVVARF